MAEQVVVGNGPVYVVHVAVTADETIDVSALTGVAAGEKVSCLKAVLATIDTDVTVEWDATANVVFAICPLDSYAMFDWSDTGGIPNNAGAGVTGDILVNLAGVGTAQVTLWLRKQA